MYAATDPSGEERAVKILNPRAGAQQMLEFENEGTLLLQLAGCSGVVDIFDSLDVSATVAVSGGGTFPIRLRFHVLKRASGSMDELAANAQMLDWPSRLSLFRDVVLGVHQMHLNDVVHRDLKCSNCLLFLQRGALSARLADLGRSRNLLAAPAAHPMLYEGPRGDPDFAPPELLWGVGSDTPETHRCADLYGVGSLFFELTFGQGITGLALQPRRTLIHAEASLPPNQRRMAYAGRASEIRAWYEPFFAAFENACPGCIRNSAGALLRQLCDPEPGRRLPSVAPGRRAQRPNELQWLLHRVDALRLTLRNDIKQRQRLSIKKEGRR
ncbi:protein kinase [Cellulomonas sp. H30R-01]|uniref:protein kinase domain-containing protein n=1 Tax=Cellulomonas sp. H30R-01 TaxID=2704467 RepID=UPI00351B7FFE